MTNNFILTLKEFEGIFGAILGTVATLITTAIIQSRGKIKLYLINSVEECFYTNDHGEYIKGNKNSDNICEYSLIYSFQIYNGTNFPKIMRDFKISFINHNEIFEVTPKDEMTTKVSTYLITTEDMDVVNIPPKEIQTWKHSITLYEDEISKIKSYQTIRLTYHDERDKKKYLIIKEN